MVRRILSEWLTSNLIFLLGVNLLFAIGTLSEFKEAVLILVIFALLSFVSITLHCILCRKVSE